MTLQDLADDGLLLIAECFERERDLNALSRTCRRLHDVLDQRLYRLHVQHHSGRALLWAAKHDRVDTARKLIAAGARPRERGVYDRIMMNITDCPSSVLSKACQHGSIGMVEMLLGAADGHEHPDWREDHGGNAVQFACLYGHVPVLEMLLRNPLVDPGARSYTGMTVLMDGFNTAAYERQPDVVEYLVRHPGTDPNRGSRSHYPTLTLAAMQDLRNTEVLGILLASPRVDPSAEDDTEGVTPLHMAACRGHPSHVAMFLQKGADPNARNASDQTPLMYAVLEQRLEAIEVLLADPRTDPNLQDNDGDTALGGIPDCPGKEDVVSLLLTHKEILPNLRDNDGLTPFSYAIKLGWTAVVEAYLASERFDLADCMPHAPRDGDGVADETWTPIMYAAVEGQAEVLEILYEDGRVPLDVRDGCGRNAMSLAAGAGKREVVELLLRVDDEVEGLGWDGPDNKGATPLMWAERSGDRGTIDLILNRLARKGEQRAAG